MEDEQPCTLLLHHEITSIPNEADLARRLEAKDDADKIATVKEIILLLLSGEILPKVMMSVIKFCIHTKNHQLRKLLYLFWEVVEKRNKNGVLLPEMILVCNSLKNDLSHPNEYVRGCSLRFLCKMKERDILESLIPSITANLDHRHSYVRKNAVLAVFSIYEFAPDMIEDAPALIETFLFSEANPSAKRNAFLMLFHHDQDRAVNYLRSVLENVDNLGEAFQLVVLELIRKVCRSQPAAKSQYIRCVHSLVNSKSKAVVFEGANTLVVLSAQPTAVRAAVTAYCNLLRHESDMNIKLIILQRLADLKRRNEKIVQEMLMDILRVLESPNMEVRSKVLQLAGSLISARNVEGVIQLLKKELKNTNKSGHTGQTGYRKLLVESLHQFSVKFPQVVGQVVQMMITYLGNDEGALDVIYYVRDILSHYPQLRSEILTKLMETFDEIKDRSVFRVALWIIGEFAEEASILDMGLLTIRESIEPLPLFKTEEEGQIDVDDTMAMRKIIEQKESKTRRERPALLADGSYASQSAVATSTSSDSKAVSDDSGSKIRSLIIEGDFFLASSVAAALTKLVLRFQEINGHGTRESNVETAKVLLIFSSILRYGFSSHAPKAIDADSSARILMCTKILLNPQANTPEKKLLMSNSKAALRKMLAFESSQSDQKEEKKKEVDVVRQADDLISIRQLKKTVDYDFLDDDMDLNRARGADQKQDIYAKLNRVYQLTGFDDPVYVEAQLTVHDYDIVLSILIHNQTAHTLQNVCVELNTSGDLKVIDRPRRFTIAPADNVSITSNIKVTSTESGVIFGNVVYDAPNGVKTIVDLSNIHMDIIDYIAPATCTDANFRAMWADFEWENKLAVITDITDLNDYLQHITNITNMRCMTNSNSMSGVCNFLAANLYARSIFGEDALLNLSVEKQAGGKIAGYIRIRSKTQGIALCLGDKITTGQRKPVGPRTQA